MKELAAFEQLDLHLDYGERQLHLSHLPRLESSRCRASGYCDAAADERTAVIWCGAAVVGEEGELCDTVEDEGNLTRMEADE